MPDDGVKEAVSMDDLNEVKSSLESSIDTKMSKMEETLTALILSLMNKDKPNVEISEVRII
jgi:hypothetical protein